MGKQQRILLRWLVYLFWCFTGNDKCVHAWVAGTSRENLPGDSPWCKVFWALGWVFLTTGSTVKGIRSCLTLAALAPITS